MMASGLLNEFQKLHTRADSHSWFGQTELRRGHFNPAEDFTKNYDLK
jgi:hypothetical protein